MVDCAGRLLAGEVDAFHGQLPSCDKCNLQHDSVVEYGRVEVPEEFHSNAIQCPL